MSLLTILSVLAAATTSCFASQPQITSKGSFLFDSTSGNRFFAKGLAYETSLADAAGCTRDVPFLKELGVNLLHVAPQDATLAHSACIELLDEAGIYVLVDLTPLPDATWGVTTVTRFIETVEAFAGYTNVLGFNLVASGNDQSAAAPFIKAAVRDVKAYIQSKKHRQLIGYTAKDVPSSRALLPYYLACDASAQIDFWGLETVEGCAESASEESGFTERTKELAEFGIPALLSQIGCKRSSLRSFDELETVFSLNMTEVWSGSIATTFSQQDSGIESSLGTSDSTSFTPNPEFLRLRNAWAEVQPRRLNRGTYIPTLNSTSPSCPSWNVTTSIPPTPNSALCSCIVDSLSCVPTSSENVSETLTEVCKTADCSSITTNGESGVYGALSFCDAYQTLSIVLDAHYESKGRDAASCDFGGRAQVRVLAPEQDDTVETCNDEFGFRGGLGIPVPATTTSTQPSAKLSTSGAFTNAIVGTRIYGFIVALILMYTL